MNFDSSYGVVIHRNFIPLYADDKYAQLFGYQSAQEILNLSSILELVEPDARDIAKHTYYALMSGFEQPQVRNYTNCNRNGEMMQVLAIEHIVEWQGLPALQITIVNLTNQMQIRQQLQASEKRYRQLVDGSIQGVLVHQNFKPVFCNQAYADILGFEKPDSILVLDSILEVIAPEWREQRQKAYQHLLNNKLTANKVQIKCIRQDSSEVWVSLIESPIIWEGEPAAQVALTDITEQYQLQQRLEHLANIDELTQLFNRRAFIEKFTKYRHQFEVNHPYYCLLMDIDNFKVINDTYGHLVGDQVITSLASVCQKCCTEEDILARWGGEEFVMVFPANDHLHAIKRVNALQQLNALQVTHPQQAQTIQFTASFGLTNWRQNDTLDTILHRADKALYQAKAQGKNQVASDF
ncbi:sensor domain-containing diguanylate cyclase [Shewanella aestuarii]|uniref:diguanylate cyclase n=1 Tax=Shewanella aestuarii TaxID=1028752 RepID=A0A6G9QP44_9GAMM|nr:sensor domain-containing diguanylate cyclase [Shewanella aestuarii]QIR15863.1 diguanylate cyclase [Shewanella aestuarii]